MAYFVLFFSGETETTKAPSAGGIYLCAKKVYFGIGQGELNFHHSSTWPGSNITKQGTNYLLELNTFSIQK